MSESTKNTKSIIAAISGNFVEWFDFALYLFLAPIIAKQFFPEFGPFALLSAFTVYAVSFFFRPLGALVFGHIGDKYGRGIALRLSLSGLALFSIIISLLPNFHQIGSLATIGLCLCRIFQGICLGGEFAGSMVYLGETTNIEKRSFFTSLTNNASNFGILMAAACTALVSFLLDEAAFERYGFRCLFFVGGLIGIIGFAFRADLKETSVFKQIKQKANIPSINVFSDYRSSVVTLFLILIISALGSYAFIGYLSTFLQDESLSLSLATRYETLFIAITLLLVPLFAHFSDKYSPARMLKWACLSYIVLAIPCYYLFYTFEQPLFFLPLVAVYSAEQSCVPALMLGFFPASVRYTGVSVTYNCCMAFIGGTSPLFGQLLIRHWQIPYGIAYLLMAGACIALICLSRTTRPSYNERRVLDY